MAKAPKAPAVENEEVAPAVEKTKAQIRAEFYEQREAELREAGDFVESGEAE